MRRYGILVRGSPEEEELSANLQALYKSLWAPIGKALPSQTKRIIISPDGELNFICFATLLTQDNQFLAQTYNVQYVASGRDLLRQVKFSTAKEVVLFANPDFGLASTEMLAKTETSSSDPGSKSIRGSEKRDVEDWSFESLEGTAECRCRCLGLPLLLTASCWRLRPIATLSKATDGEMSLYRGCMNRGPGVVVPLNRGSSFQRSL